MRYRRLTIPGASYFFTVVTENRRPLFSDQQAVAMLACAIAEVRSIHPFELDAQVILPDHLHALWTLPENDANFSTRWRLIKSTFTRNFCRLHPVPEASASRAAKGERCVWQRRFWEHTISTEADFEAHMDYIHFNPVKHGFVQAPRDWPYSTFLEWVARERYDIDWGTDRANEIAKFIARE